jgi:hypothetical protein
MCWAIMTRRSGEGSCPLYPQDTLGALKNALLRDYDTRTGISRSLPRVHLSLQPTQLLSGTGGWELVAEYTALLKALSAKLNGDMATCAHDRYLSRCKMWRESAVCHAASKPLKAVAVHSFSELTFILRPHQDSSALRSSRSTAYSAAFATRPWSNCYVIDMGLRWTSPCWSSPPRAGPSDLVALKESVSKGISARCYLSYSCTTAAFGGYERRRSLASCGHRGDAPTKMLLMKTQTVLSSSWYDSQLTDTFHASRSMNCFSNQQHTTKVRQILRPPFFPKLLGSSKEKAAQSLPRRIQLSIYLVCSLPLQHQQRKAFLVSGFRVAVSRLAEKPREREEQGSLAPVETKGSSFFHVQRGQVGSKGFSSVRGGDWAM